MLDDNGNKILLAKFVDQRNEPTEPDVFQFERTVDGKEAVLTEREKDRLRRYLAEAFGREETRPCYEELQVITPKEKGHQRVLC